MTAYISGFTGILGARGTNMQVAYGETEEQTVTTSGSSVQSSAFNVATKVIRVHTDTACKIKINSNPTATATSMRLAADQTEYFGVNGGTDKIAVF
jgi:hypothetical protein